VRRLITGKTAAVAIARARPRAPPPPLPPPPHARDGQKSWRSVESSARISQPATTNNAHAGSGPHLLAPLAALQPCTASRRSRPPASLPRPTLASARRDALDAALTRRAGSAISLISKSEIRYEGVLYTIDTVESTVALQNGAREGLGFSARSSPLRPQCAPSARRGGSVTARRLRPPGRCTTSSFSAAATLRTCRSWRRRVPTRASGSLHPHPLLDAALPAR